MSSRIAAVRVEPRAHLWCRTSEIRRWQPRSRAQQYRARLPGIIRTIVRLPLSMEPSRDLQEVARRFRRVAPAVDQCTIRIVEESSIVTSVRRDVPEPVACSTDVGAMVTVARGDGVGYA